MKQELIKTYRLKKKLSMDELATKAGVSKGAISRIERNLSETKVGTLERIAKALKVRPSIFFD
jgi:transcriptional regulator with XRE-family HTH domain